MHICAYFGFFWFVASVAIYFLIIFFCIFFMVVFDTIVLADSFVLQKESILCAVQGPNNELSLVVGQVNHLVCVLEGCVFGVPGGFILLQVRSIGRPRDDLDLSSTFW